MSEQIVAFPKQRKRGAKKRSGPVADVLHLKGAGPTADTGQVSATPQEEDFSKQLLAALNRSFARQDSEDRNAFDDWLAGKVVTAAEYTQRTRWGSALDDPGCGPYAYRMAVRKVREEDVLRFNEHEKALQLAVGMLNDLATLVRWGGLRVGLGNAKEGFDDVDLRTCETAAISDLAFTMKQLRAFGARA